MREKFNLFIKQANEAIELFAKITLFILAISVISIIVAIVHFSVFAGFVFFVITSSIFVFVLLHRKK